jgi:hypothetical protein
MFGLYVTPVLSYQRCCFARVFPGGCVPHGENPRSDPFCAGMLLSSWFECLHIRNSS